MINEINTLLTIGTLLSHIFIIITVVYILLRKIKTVKKFFKPIESHFKKNGLNYAFLTSLFATLGSLFYSQIVGFTPCVLCWYQRIFMYVLPIILFIAIIYKDYKVKKYVIPLSIIGASIALYHYIVQLTPRFTCVADGVDCSIRYIIGFEYITIPLMALTAFILITGFTYLQKK